MGRKKQRLWITSTIDYTVTLNPAHVILLQLLDNLNITIIGQWNLTLGTLEPIPEKKGLCWMSTISSFSI